MKKIAMMVVAALALAGCSSGSSEPAASSTPVAQVSVTGAYILPNGDVAGMFGDVANAGSQSVKLTGGSAPDVGMVQIHEYVKDGTTETMKEIPGGLEIPAGGSVALKPGGYHVMMMQVTADWQVGDTVPVTLNLSDGTSVTVQAEVKQREGMADGSMS